MSKKMGVFLLFLFVCSSHLQGRIIVYHHQKSKIIEKPTPAPFLTEEMKVFMKKLSLAVITKIEETKIKPTETLSMFTRGTNTKKTGAIYLSKNIEIPPATSTPTIQITAEDLQKITELLKNKPSIARGNKIRALPFCQEFSRELATTDGSFFIIKGHPYFGSFGIFAKKRDFIFRYKTDWWRTNSTGKGGWIFPKWYITETLVPHTDIIIFGNQQFPPTELIELIKATIFEDSPTFYERNKRVIVGTSIAAGLLTVALLHDKYQNSVKNNRFS